MRKQRTSLLLLLAAVVIGGCARIPADDEVPAGSTACAGEPTRPISQAVLVKTLRRHGFTVYSDPSDAICPSRDAAPPGLESHPDEDMTVSVTNIFFEGPHENIDAHDEISRREGHLSCGLRRGPIWGPKLEKDLDAPPASPIFSGDKAEFYVANVECVIYPEGPRRATHVRKLDRAMEEIARLSRR